MEHGVAIASVAVIIGAPILSNFGFRYGFVENIVVRIFLVGMIIYAIKTDVFLGLITFLAVFTLLLERNHALAVDLPKQRNNILPNVNSVPMKAPSVEKRQVYFEQVGGTPLATFGEEERDIHDNNPRLEAAPGSVGAAAFFKTLGV
jgi:hypothetical protein